MCKALPQPLGLTLFVHMQAHVPISHQKNDRNVTGHRGVFVLLQSDTCTRILSDQADISLLSILLTLIGTYCLASGGKLTVCPFD